MIIANSIKAFLFMLAVTSATYADTNSVDESSDISSQYIAGDIVSTEGEFQIEVLENTEDRIEIGLFNREDQITTMLIWDVKAESGNVMLNLDTEDEQTLPIQISKHMNPDNRMEALANGLLLMEAQTTESISPEEAKLEPDSTANVGVLARNASSAVTTSGWIVPSDSQPNPSHPVHQGPGRDNVTRKLIGRARYNLADGDTRHVWVRLLTRNSDGKWKIMGWAHAKKPNNRFSFAIPELYDIDRTSNDLNITNLSKIQGVADNKIAYTFSREYAADAWSGDGKRTNFAWVKLNVVWVLPGPNVNVPGPKF
jgi:hypothetical protein